MSGQPPETGNGKDFFISYASSDEAHAKQIAAALEAAGYSVELAAWHFPPGGSFVERIQSALVRCRRLIPVRSSSVERLG